MEQINSFPAEIMQACQYEIGTNISIDTFLLQATIEVNYVLFWKSVPIYLSVSCQPFWNIVLDRQKSFGKIEMKAINMKIQLTAVDSIVSADGLAPSDTAMMPWI